MAAPMAGELPIRVIALPGASPVIRCLCGLESAVIRSSTVNSSMTGLRSSGPARPRLSADLTPAAVLAMIMHAQMCSRAREIAEQQASG